MGPNIGDMRMANKTNISVSVRNDHSKEVFAEISKKLDEALVLCGARAERNAKINIENDPHRVDTGLLRNSITYAMGGEKPAVTSYRGDNPSRYGGTEIPTGSYAGTAPNEPHSMYIGTNVSYAPYVHEGTQKMRANRFLRDAIQGHEKEYQAIINQVMKKRVN